MKCQFQTKAVTVSHYNKRKHDKSVKARSKFNPKRQQNPPDVEIDLVSDRSSRGHHFYKPIMDNVREAKKMIHLKRISFNTHLHNEALFTILSTCSSDKAFLADKGRLPWFAALKSQFTNSTKR